MANMEGWSPNFNASLGKTDGNGKAQGIDYLRAADLEVHDIAFEKKHFDYNDLPDEIPAQKKEEIRGRTLVTITTSHVDEDGNTVHFDMHDEIARHKKGFLSLALGLTA